ncbi:MAG: hypothetical protein NTX91_00055, partial [candidate division SR1 bacterium]|nr:hypothetical protein [candidate division SR1 bacterium]
HLSSEKIGRAFEKGYYSSRIGADPKKCEFPGGLIAKYGWIMVLIGVSGLLSDEDEMAAFVLHSHLLKLSPNKLKTVIYPNEASVPWEVFNPDGYIWRTLSPYCYKH